jgi:predicted lactoylglutathione lyase
MSTTLFVNMAVKDLKRSQEFFSRLGFDFFGMTEDMASVVISERTQVMLMTDLDNPKEVDEFVEKAFAAGATAIGEPVSEGGRYQRGFADLDGHHWSALCLAPPEG